MAKFRNKFEASIQMFIQHTNTA